MAADADLDADDEVAVGLATRRHSRRSRRWMSAHSPTMTVAEKAKMPG